MGLGTGLGRVVKAMKAVMVHADKAGLSLYSSGWVIEDRKDRQDEVMHGMQLK